MDVETFDLTSCAPLAPLTRDQNVGASWRMLVLIVFASGEEEIHRCRLIRPATSTHRGAADADWMHGRHVMGDLSRVETMRVFRCQSGSSGNNNDSSSFTARIADWMDDYTLSEGVHGLKRRRRVGDSALHR
jgi:hypothetical protein